MNYTEALDDLLRLTANNAAMRTRLEEREKRGLKIDRSDLNAGEVKAAELRAELEASLTPRKPTGIITEVDLDAYSELLDLANAAVSFALPWRHGIGHSCSAFHDDYTHRTADGLNDRWRTLRDRAYAWNAVHPATVLPRAKARA